MQNEVGESYEDLLSLSSTIPLACFREVWRYLKETRGLSSPKRMSGLRVLTHYFQTLYRIPSGSLAEEREDLEKVYFISSAVRAIAQESGYSRHLSGGEDFGGKKCSSRVALISLEVSAPGSEGK